MRLEGIGGGRFGGKLSCYSRCCPVTEYDLEDSNCDITGHWELSLIYFFVIDCSKLSNMAPPPTRISAQSIIVK